MLVGNQEILIFPRISVSAAATILDFNGGESGVLRHDGNVGALTQSPNPNRNRWFT